MVEEPYTKEVFRELDGFLVVVSMLSTLAPPETLQDGENSFEQRLEATRLSFAIISEATSNHPMNTEFFTVSILLCATTSCAELQ
jgi:hypothetical protein